MRECECEHANHFDKPTEVHKYGKKAETKPVSTDFGTFNVCQSCLDMGHILAKGA